MKTVFCPLIFCLSLLLLPAGLLRAADRRVLPSRAAEVAARLPLVTWLPATNRLQLAIGLPLRNQDTLTNLIPKLYAPGNTNFHRYLTPAQFAEQFGPVDTDYQTVLNFVKSHHCEAVQEYGNHALVDIAGTVADIQNMFQVSLGYYRHPTEDRMFFAPAGTPTIESGVPISYVVGLDNYSKPQPNAREVQGRSRNPQPGAYNGSGTNNLYLAADLRNAYVPGVPLEGAGQVVGLVEYVGYTPGDVVEYESLAGLVNPPPVLPIVLAGAPGVPCTNCGSFNLEVALDIDMVLAMAPKLDEVLVVEGTSDVDVMNELATLVNSSTGKPLVNQISSSWTLSIDAECIPRLWQMAAQGQTFFLCSFDAGAPTSGIQSSVTDQNYLTMVGGTELSMNGVGASWQSEVVWGPPYTGTNGGSTGYIETGLPIPNYQKEVNTTANGGSSTYRNVPDVAMCADWIEIVDTVTYSNRTARTGNITGAAGTSAAAPLWAAFTALVNEQAGNVPPIGFLNPALYDLAQSPFYTNYFHDVISGANTNNNSPNLFFAGPGYDNCTGLGTPKGQAMINALAGYAGPIWVNFSGACPGNGSYTNPFCTLDAATNAVPIGGNIWIIGPNSSSQTPTIAKPMILRAYNGAVTLGH